MTTAQTMQRLRALKLSAMAYAFERQIGQPGLNDVSFEDRFAMLVEAEHSQRDGNRIRRLIQTAGFPEQAAAEDYENISTRGLDTSLFRTLSTCQWIDHRLNLLIVGPTGVGKSWIASALGNQACRLGMSVVFYRVSDLYAKLAEAQNDGSLPALKARLTRATLLILDDLGLGQMTPVAAHILLDIMERRQHSGSLIITSQFPPAAWHDSFPDPTVADAALDRIIHQSHRLNLKGESLRKRRGEQRLKLSGLSTTLEKTATSRD